MRIRWWSRRASALFWVSLFSAYAVAAVGVVVLDATGDGYDALSDVEATTVYAEERQRNLGAAQMAAVYRARSGTPFTALPPGSTVRIVWPDGSSEYVAIGDPAVREGARSLPGTQRAADEAGVHPGDAAPGAGIEAGIEAGVEH